MHSISHTDETLDLTYGGRHCRESIPKYQMPARGMPPDNAYQLVADELQFDANAALNVASFVNTWMEPQADRLMQMTMGKNLIDQEEYPQTTNIAKRVLSMVAHLFHAPAASEAVGCITSGSSEALMLAFLAHHRAWTLRRRAQGLDTARPNMIFGADAHTCLEKCAAYFDIEARILPMTAKRRTLHAKEVAAAIDERTVAVCAILGTTFTGQLDDIAGINNLLATIEAERNWRIPLHIDAASGGFVLPFTEPDYAWDFRLSHVRSINVSNHKFGLVYPGMGTLIFREKSDIPEELIFHINYLGGDMPNFSLNFSRPSGQVVAQYYNMLRLGHEGYCNVMRTIMSNARYLAARLREMDSFSLLGAAEHVPVVVARATDPETLNVMKLADRPQTIRLGGTRLHLAQKCSGNQSVAFRGTRESQSPHGGCPRGRYPAHARKTGTQARTCGASTSQGERQRRQTHLLI